MDKKMNVMEAIETRHSVRGFLDKPVDEETIRKVVAAANCAPSWACTRPWQYYVATGEAVERIRKEYVALNTAKAPVDYDIPCNPVWPERENTNTLTWGANRLKVQWDVDPNDPKDEAKLNEVKEHLQVMMSNLFYAPTLVVSCMDKGLHNWALYDMGASAMELQLAAHNYGLGVITAYHLVRYPKVLREVLGIPDNLEVVCGMAMGYKDEDSVENKYIALRTPVEEMCTIVK